MRCSSDAIYTSTLFASVAESDSMVGLFWQRDRFYDRAGRAISIAHWAELRGNCEYRTIGDWCDGRGPRHWAWLLGPLSAGLQLRRCFPA